MNFEYDVVIAGGGISGLMMAKRLELLHPGMSVAVLDKGGFIDHSFHLHRPIPELNHDWHATRFHLGIWDEKGLRSDITPLDVNIYSAKVRGQLCPTNILNYHQQQQAAIYPISKQELQDLLKTKTVHHHNVGIRQIWPQAKEVETDINTFYKYKYLVNTIALPIFLDLCRLKTELHIQYNPFYCLPVEMGYHTGLYQMVYNTSWEHNVTRATLVDDKLYLDLRAKSINAADRRGLLKLFGVDVIGIPREIYPGRFNPFPKDQRKQFIHHLTAAFDMFLLGRYGAWTFKVANDVWDDTEFLCELITNKEHTIKGGLLCSQK